jgi:hypothetical protein
MPATAETEQQAIITDARHRLVELQAVRNVLLPAIDGISAVAAELAADRRRDLGRGGSTRQRRHSQPAR